MEPGLRDREYAGQANAALSIVYGLQWSPVLETGNTTESRQSIIGRSSAAMEPGLRDREYLPRPSQPRHCI